MTPLVFRTNSNTVIPINSLVLKGSGTNSGLNLSSGSTNYLTNSYIMSSALNMTTN